MSGDKVLKKEKSNVTVFFFSSLSFSFLFLFFFFFSYVLSPLHVGVDLKIIRMSGCLGT